MLHDRVAPRSTCAENFLVVVSNRGKVTAQETIPQPIHDRVALVHMVREHHIDTLICGANSAGTRESLLEADLSLIENVAGSASEVVTAIESGTLRNGYGLLTRPRKEPAPNRPDSGGLDPDTPMASAGRSDRTFDGDCLACSAPACLKTGRCSYPPGEVTPASLETLHMLEAAADITFESERPLCRMAELVYFVIEMGFRRVGVAFCSDLIEPTRLLCSVLRRYVQVFAASCRIETASPDFEQLEPSDRIEPSDRDGLPCNPLAQARILGQFGSELNIIVGLCMGADAVFAKASQAPVTTLFVKDRMLANNPIGAVYSEYYLSEISKT